MSYFYLFLLLLPTFFSLSIHCSPIIEASTHHDPGAYYNCTRNTTFATNSAYRSNIKTLLHWLSTNGTTHPRSYNTTVVSRNPADTVFGLFVCSVDLTPQSCEECVIEAAKLIYSLCTTSNEAIIWYQVCFVHYSNRSFFSTVEESPKLTFMNDQDYVGQVGRFNNIVWDMLNDLRNRAIDDPNKVAYKSANITKDQKLYGSAWCLPYLSKENCSWCLSDAIAEIPTGCCRGKSGGTILYPSCGVRYELYPFRKAHMTVSSVLPPPLPTPPGALAL